MEPAGSAMGRARPAPRLGMSPGGSLSGEEAQEERPVSATSSFKLRYQRLEQDVQQSPQNLEVPSDAALMGSRHSSADSLAGIRRRPTEQEELVNWEPKPRYPGELAFALTWAAIVVLVTGWIVASMVALLAHWTLWRFNVTLGVLGAFALFLGSYVSQIGIGAVMWTRRYKATKDKDWYSEWRAQRGQPNVKEWSDVQHFVIVTAYKESIGNIKSVAYTLMSQRTPKDTPGRFCKRQITMVLAMEQREGQPGADKAREVTEDLGHHFRDVLTLFHPPDRRNEIAGKASNYRYAVQEIDLHIQSGGARLVDQHGADAGAILAENVLIHVCDGDSLYDPNHFPNVTYDFCTYPERYYSVWQPCMLPTCNFWELPFCTRQLGIMIAAQEMMSARSHIEFQIPFSTYCMPLETLRGIGGAGGAGAAQDGDVIAEDHHLFIKGFFATSGRLHVRPVNLPCFNYSVEGCECIARLGCLRKLCCRNKSGPQGVWDSRFSQATRHMFGLSELAYFFSLVARGGPGLRRYRFGSRWTRVIALGLKMLKIHSVAWLGLWVTLGIVLSAMLKMTQAACELEQLPHLRQVQLEYLRHHPLCNSDWSATTYAVGAVIFTATTTLGFIGAMSVLFAFTKMLNATQDAMAILADPNAMGEVFEDGHPNRVRLVPMNRGGAWCGVMIQLALEYAAAGFVSSILYGAIPSFIALTNLIRNGHRLKYVSAAEVAEGGKNFSEGSHDSYTTDSEEEDSGDGGE